MAYDKDAHEREKKDKGNVVKDERGRWVKGAPSPNPNGRPRREVEAAYLNKLISTVSQEDWEIITAKAVEDSKRGDPQARKWLSDYIMGTPTAKISVIDEKEEQEIIISFGEPTPDITDRVNGMQKLLTETSEDDT